MSIRPATRGDLPALDHGLSALSQTLGDPHAATQRDLERVLFGPAPIARALLAEAPDPARPGPDALAGLVLFTPLFSTARGVAGAYVSDLWVAEPGRGRGTGARLLAGVRDASAQAWGAGFLRLGVYRRTPRARAFYDRLGFVHDPEETYLTLAGPALAGLATHGGGQE
ncbi:MAG: N-acetyltransferase family protein [Alkalilacustris sp.]